MKEPEKKERNLEIVEMRKNGETFVNIALHFSISKSRAARIYSDYTSFKYLNGANK